MAVTPTISERHPGYEQLLGTRIQDVNGTFSPALVNLNRILTGSRLLPYVDDTLPIVDVLRANPMLDASNPGVVDEADVEPLFHATVRTLAAMDGERYDMVDFGFTAGERQEVETMLLAALMNIDPGPDASPTGDLVAALRATRPADAELTFDVLRADLVRMCAAQQDTDASLRAVQRYIEISEALAPSGGLTQAQRLRIMRNMVNAAAAFFDENADRVLNIMPK
jgi:hypothetical protein